MHPIKAAIDTLHAEVGKLREATQDFEFTAEERSKVIDVMVGYIPAAMNAAEELFTSFLTYLTNR